MSPVWILFILLPILGGAERFKCKGRILGAYYADVKAGCKAFHVCVRVAGGGVRDFRFFCPPGTLFHQEAQTCTDWGDDDPLACPADIYDGQFDLYRIGSGYDTRKLSSSGPREDEAEFGLQRAETGDRRLSQDNVASSGLSSDLRAAHSSDFFSGQRDRGRDDFVPQPAPAPSAPPARPTLYPQQRQSFRRSTTQRALASTQYTTPPPQPPKPSKQPSYEVSKRKLVRKRPYSVPTAAPTTYYQSTPPQQTNQVNSEPVQNINHRPQQNQKRQQQSIETPNVPPQYKQYKEEYVEVSRVTPKPNRLYPNNVPSTSLPSSTPVSRYNNNKKEGLVEVYDYEAQSTPGLNQQNDNRQFKVKDSFNVADVPREIERARNYNLNNIREKATTTNFVITTRAVPNTTPAYKNYNSVSYEPEKNNFVSYSKQNYFNTPTTRASTTAIHTTARPDPPPNLNTIAYNTNIAFQTHSSNYADGNEDDGQYHPPQGEDDGQYKPELYDHELLSGAHSLNIAASGNRLPEERKLYAKTKPQNKPISQTVAPRPFKVASTPTLPPSTRAPEPTTTYVPNTVSTQRTFDYYKTYTTTSRPGDYLGLGLNIPSGNDVPARPTTEEALRVLENRPTRPPTRAPAPTLPPAPAPKPTTRAPHFVNSPNNKEESSYDYAYYDSDPGFSEYDPIEEFGKTKNKA